MRYALLIVLLFCVSGCAFLDSLAGTTEVQQTDESGAPEFKDAQGNVTTDAVDPSTGVPNTPIMYSVVTGGNVDTVSGIASRFGPWGALAGGILATVGGVYARSRNRKFKLAESAATFAAGLVEKIKNGDAVDVDGNGRISISELKSWVVRQGSRFTDPSYLAQIARLAETAAKP
ncbi:MAG: hypothetical protein OEY28_00125 [Nitrospira sp.]|nr:hypothetical protein [Nitrospira sp.]